MVAVSLKKINKFEWLEREIVQESLKCINGGVREVKGESGRWEKLPYIATLDSSRYCVFCTAAVQPVLVPVQPRLTIYVHNPTRRYNRATRR